MLRTLRRLFGLQRPDPAQLALPLDPPRERVQREAPALRSAPIVVDAPPSTPVMTPRGTAPAPDAEQLLRRLRALGLQRIERCRLTRNRNVMVSFAGNALRVHEGYVDAPEQVLRAIVTFVEGRTRAERRAAQRVIVAFPVRTNAAPQRRERTRREDEPLVAELVRWHAQLNAQHFGGRLRNVDLRVSRRMRTRLGHYTAATPREPAEIAISWRHIKRHGWEEARHTLLHEMVHQWQDEAGHTIDHGRTFRTKAREVGIAPQARRTLARKPGHAPGEQSIGRRAARGD